MAKAPSAIARLDPWVHGPAVTRLFAEAFGSVDAPTGAIAPNVAPSEWAIDEDTLGLVWLDSGQVGGAVTALPSPWIRNNWIIANLVTDRRFRRRGIARALLIELMRICVSQGATSFQLQVDSNNSPAISLYRNLGFIQVGEMIVARPSDKTPITHGGQSLARLATPSDLQGVNELLQVTYAPKDQNLAHWQTATKTSIPPKALNKTSGRIFVEPLVHAAALVICEPVKACEAVTIYPICAQKQPVGSAANFIRSLLVQLAPATGAAIEFQTTSSDLVCQMALSKLACTTVRRFLRMCNMGGSIIR